MLILFSGIGGDNLAMRPKLGSGAGGGFTLVGGTVFNLGGVTAAVKTRHIEAPALFLLKQRGAGTQRAVLQGNTEEIIHRRKSFPVNQPR